MKVEANKRYLIMDLSDEYTRYPQYHEVNVIEVAGDMFKAKWNGHDVIWHKRNEYKIVKKLPNPTVTKVEG